MTKISGLSPGSRRFVRRMANSAHADHKHLAMMDRRLSDSMFNLANLFAKKSLSFEYWIDNAINIASRAFQHRDICAIECDIEGMLFRTDGYKKTPWRIVRPIKARMLPLDDDNLLNLIDQTPRRRNIGSLTVCYLEKRPEEYIGPFTMGEIRFVNLMSWYASNITERVWREERMNAYAERVRSMTSTLAMAEQRQRRGFAEILHDKIGQNLSLLNLQIEGAMSESSPSPVISEIKEARKTLQLLIADSRDLTFELCPPLLYESGLDAAIRWLVSRFVNKHDLAISCSTEIRPGHPEEVLVTLYQAAQELLVNVVKHSRATRARLKLFDKNGEITLSLEDNGRGFRHQESVRNKTESGGFGLFNLQSKLVHLGGNLKIKTGKAGTTVIVSLPVKSQMIGG